MLAVRARKRAVLCEGLRIVQLGRSVWLWTKHQKSAGRDGKGLLQRGGMKSFTW